MFFKRWKTKKTLSDCEANVDRCLCIDCPSYIGEVLFCVRGESSKPIEKKGGCLCAFCPVFHEYELYGCCKCQK